MLDTSIIVVVVVAAVLIGAAAYIFLSRKKATQDALNVTPFTKWTISFSSGVPSEMAKNVDGSFSFDFPAEPGWVGYIAATSVPIKLGDTITMKFAVQGNGTIVPHPNAGAGPARVRLFLWRKNDNMGSDFYRWWSVNSVEITNGGDFTLSQKIDPALWSSVMGTNGASSDQATQEFNKTLNEIALVGFTFGAMFAGHGDYVKDGTAKYVLKSYTVT